MRNCKYYTDFYYFQRLPLKHYFYEEKGEMKVPNLTLVWSDSKLSGTKQVQIALYIVVHVCTTNYYNIM